MNISINKKQFNIYTLNNLNKQNYSQSSKSITLSPKSDYDNDKTNDKIIPKFIKEDNFFLSPIKSHFKRKTKTGYLVSYAPRPKLILSKPNTTAPVLKQFIKANSEISIADTLFSFSPGKHNKDFYEFKTNYSNKYSQIGESFSKSNSYFASFAFSNETMKEYHQKALNAIKENSNLLLNRLKLDTQIDFSTWKEIILSSYDVIELMNKIINGLFKEVVHSNDKNKKANKKITDIEMYYAHKMSLLNLKKANQKEKKKQMAKAILNSPNSSLSRDHSLNKNEVDECRREDNKKLLEIYRLEEE